LYVDVDSVVATWPAIPERFGSVLLVQRVSSFDKPAPSRGLAAAYGTFQGTFLEGRLDSHQARQIVTFRNPLRSCDGEHAGPDPRGEGHSSAPDGA